MKALRLLLILPLLFALYFAYPISKNLYQYYDLKGQTKASVSSWKVAPYKGDFALQATYTFHIQQKPYQGQTTFRHPLFLNEWSAQIAAQDLSSEGWNVYYSPKNPSYNSLEKYFPFKEMLYLLVTLGVALYFYILKSRLSS